MTFRIGQRVVCVRNDFTNRADYVGVAIPEIGHVYTVRDVAPGLFNRDVAVILLTELINPKFDTFLGPQEIGFESIAFRPVVDRKTDIAIFKRMLVPNERETV